MNKYDKLNSDMLKCAKRKMTEIDKTENVRKSFVDLKCTNKFVARY